MLAFRAPKSDGIAHQEAVVLWHVVKFRLRPEVGPGDRAAFERMLADLAGAVPSLRFVRVAPSVDEPGVVGLLTGFDDADGLEAYKVHEAHLPVIARARELSAEIVRLDVETPDPPDALPLRA